MGAWIAPNAMEWLKLDEKVETGVSTFFYKNLSFIFSLGTMQR
jgi:hypothetical protein